MDNGPRLFAGSSTDIATALMDDKPVSADLRALYDRVLSQHIAELVEKHGASTDLSGPLVIS
jgi:hypothetical protein